LSNPVPAHPGTGFFLSQILKVFKNIPFFRICIPSVAGILLAVQFGFAPLNWLFLPALLAAAGIFLLTRPQTVLSKRLFLVCADIFLFCFGLHLVSEARATGSSDHYGNFVSADTSVNLLVMVNDMPVEKPNFIKCRLKVLGLQNAGGFRKASGEVIGYFKKKGWTGSLKFGDRLFVGTKLMEPEEPRNPEEFNYKAYLNNRQVFHLFFADSADVEKVNAGADISAIREFGIKVRSLCLRRLKSSELTKEAWSICAALLTGYDEEIETPVTEAFAHSGTLHVLSVSGLHTGLIYLMLAFLFDLFDRRRKYSIAKLLFITVSLWFFALVTGFSAPVLRAVIMFNLFGFGRIFFRNDHRNQINILLVSAFITLCYDPFLIRDIGFLLSYFALFGILSFQPVFAALWQPENRILKQTWTNVTASFAATLTTLPFTLFYFKQFPIWFFVCNLVVVPLTFVVLVLALLLVLNFSKAALLINPIIKFLLWFIGLFNTAGTGYIDLIDFTWLDAALLSVFIVFLSLTFYYRSFRFAALSLTLLMLWQLNGIVTSLAAKSVSQFAVYHIKKQTVCCVKNKTSAVLDTLSGAGFNYHVRPHLVTFNYPGLQRTPFNLVRAGRTGIVILRQRDSLPAVPPAGISVAVVANNFNFGARELRFFPEVRTIVADGTNNKRTLQQLAELCGKFGIEFYSTRHKGAFILKL
jgi:competence protein ComEC